MSFNARNLHTLRNEKCVLATERERSPVATPSSLGLHLVSLPVSPLTYGYCFSVFNVAPSWPASHRRASWGSPPRSHEENMSARRGNGGKRGKNITCISASKGAICDFLVRKCAASRLVDAAAGNGAIGDALWWRIGGVREVERGFDGGGGREGPVRNKGC